MTDQLPRLPNDDSDQETAPHISQNTVPSPAMREPQARRQGQEPVRQSRPPTNFKKGGRQNQPQQNETALYFPLWSLALMLLVVLLIAFGVVLLIVALGGNASAPDADPIFRIITAEPSNTPDIPDPNEILLATATLPESIQVILPAQTPANLTLDGPALPTFAFTTTPIPLSVGIAVIVADVGDQELNVRDIAGVTASTVVYRVPEGTQLTIVDGPQQADGFTWWRVQNPANGQSGWAVANYLLVFQQES